MVRRAHSPTGCFAEGILHTLSATETQYTVYTGACVYILLPLRTIISQALRQTLTCGGRTCCHAPSSSPRMPCNQTPTLTVTSQSLPPCQHGHSVAAETRDDRHGDRGEHGAARGPAAQSAICVASAPCRHEQRDRVATSTVEGSGWKDFWQHHGSRKRRAGDAHQHGNHGVHVAVGAVHSQQWRHVHSCKSAQPSNFSTRFEALLLTERFRDDGMDGETRRTAQCREHAVG